MKPNPNSVSSPGALLRIAMPVLVLAGMMACASAAPQKSAETAGDSTATRDVAVAGKGCVAGDCQNGTGTYVYENGDRYVGPFKDGLRSGQGAFEYANGDRFTGEYVAGERNGTGTYIFKNGDRYVGNFSKGLRAGQGVYTFHQGGVFRGEFVEDGNKGGGVFVQGETPFECDLRGRGLFCAAAEQKKMIQPATEDPMTKDAMTEDATTPDTNAPESDASDDSQ
jgi:hypothetical protein